MKIGEISAARPVREDGAVAERLRPADSNAAGVAAATVGVPPLPEQQHEAPMARQKAEDMQRVAENLSKTAQIFNVQAKFSVHKATKEIMVKIVDTRTGQVLREIPPEKMLDLAAAMRELLGLVVDKKA